mmetsp:Transcript_38988/g.69791  ORF Transcript_38988/g.69791 Transcript_38988/m.69791 type:complete len:113 (-) Transcript_38988:683-1021(-)
MTLERLAQPSKVLLRLSHQYGLGEHPYWSQPWSVDLGVLRFPRPLHNCTETSLSGNQPKGSMPRPEWQVDRLGQWQAHAWRRLPPVQCGRPTGVNLVSLGPLEIKTLLLDFE